MTVQQILITSNDIRFMLGGISRATFYNWRKRWEQDGTPFPNPVPNLSANGGGSLYRKRDVMNFLSQIGIID